MRKIFFVIILIIFPLVASAAVLELKNPLKADTFTKLVNNIANWVFLLASPLAFLIFMWGGFLFMVSGGNEEKVTKAKQLMFWAAIGLMVCLIGTGLTSILKQLLGGTPSSPPSEFKVPGIGEPGGPAVNWPEILEPNQSQPIPLPKSE